MKALFAFLLLFVSSFAWAVPTTISVVTVSTTAAAFADNAADTSNGNRFLNPNCDAIVLLQNTHGANSSTVTVTSQRATLTAPGYGTVAVADLSIVLAAGAKKHIGPLPCSVWNDSSGYVQVTYSGTGTVLVSPIRYTRP